MPRRCAVNLDHLQTVAKARVGPLITTLRRETMNEVERAIAFALGFSP
jgi:mRNA interferase MazF